MRSIQIGFPLRDTHEISRARSTPCGRTAEDSHPSSPRIHRDLLVAAYENACTSPPAEWIEKISSLSRAHTSIRGRVSEWIFSPCALPLNDRALRRQSLINIACTNDIRRTSEICILRIDFYYYWINFLKRVIETEEQFNELSKNHLIIHKVWKVKKERKGDYYRREKEKNFFHDSFSRRSFAGRGIYIYIYRTRFKSNKIQ